MDNTLKVSGGILITIIIALVGIIYNNFDKRLIMVENMQKSVIHNQMIIANKLGIASFKMHDPYIQKK